MRQYIGARYVPTFYQGTNGTEWESGVAYEGLTVVTYLSASYTSKKPVPPTVGNPYDNREYWALTANFPGQIGDLTQRVADLSEDIEDVNDRIDEVVAGLAGRKFILVGDSYGMRNPVNWVSLAQQYLDVVAENAVSGAAFGEATESLRFETILQGITSNLTTAQKESVTDIVICGGWNDARCLVNGETTGASMQQRILNCLAIRNQSYPQAKLHVGFIGWQIYNGVQASEITGNALEHAKDIYNNTIRDGLYHLQNCGYATRNCDTMDDTHFHPNSDGGANLFTSIFGEISGLSTFEKKLYYVQNEIATYESNIINGMNCLIMTNNGENHFKTSLFNMSKDIDADECIIKFNKAIIPFSKVSEQIFANVFIDGTLTLYDESTVNYHGTMLGVIGAFSTLSNGQIGMKLIYNGSSGQITHVTGRMKIEAFYNTDALSVPF